jgi:hypothetical protein
VIIGLGHHVIIMDVNRECGIYHFLTYCLYLPATLFVISAAWGRKYWMETWRSISAARDTSTAAASRLETAASRAVLTAALSARAASAIVLLFQLLVSLSRSVFSCLLTPVITSSSDAITPFSAWHVSATFWRSSSASSGN